MPAAYQSHLTLAHVPAAQAGLARSAVAAATRMGGGAAAHAQLAFADGMRLALLITAGIVPTAAVTVATLMRQAAPLAHCGDQNKIRISRTTSGFTL